MAVFTGGPWLDCTRMSVLDIQELRMTGSGGDSRSYNACRALVKWLPPTPNFFTGRMPFLLPNQQ